MRQKSYQLRPGLQAKRVVQGIYRLDRQDNIVHQKYTLLAMFFSLFEIANENFEKNGSAGSAASGEEISDLTVALRHLLAALLQNSSVC